MQQLADGAGVGYSAIPAAILVGFAGLFARGAIAALREGGAAWHAPFIAGVAPAMGAALSVAAMGVVHPLQPIVYVCGLGLAVLSLALAWSSGGAPSSDGAGSSR